MTDKPTTETLLVGLDCFVLDGEWKDDVRSALLDYEKVKVENERLLKNWRARDLDAAKAEEKHQCC